MGLRWDRMFSIGLNTIWGHVQTQWRSRVAGSSSIPSCTYQGTKCSWGHWTPSKLLKSLQAISHLHESSRWETTAFFFFMFVFIVTSYTKREVWVRIDTQKPPKCSFWSFQICWKPVEIKTWTFRKTQLPIVLKEKTSDHFWICRFQMMNVICTKCNKLVSVKTDVLVLSDKNTHRRR